MKLTQDNAVCSFKHAQRLLSSPRMMPPTLKPYLERLQQQAGVDLSRLIQLSDNILTFMSGTRHQTIKKALNPVFNEASLSRYQVVFLQIAKHHFASLIRSKSSVDLVKDVETPLFIRQTEQVFGFTPADHEAFIAQIRNIVRVTEPLQSLRTLLNVQHDFSQLVDAIADQLAALAPLLADQTTPGLIYTISHALQDAFTESPSLNTDELTQLTATVVALLIVASRTTTETFINIIMNNAKANPSNLGSTCGDSDWVAANINELIRFSSSTAYLTRRAESAMKIDDLTVDTDETLFFHIPSINRDADWFERCEYADIFDPNQPHTKRQKRHLSFGSGIHRCPGEQLAILALCQFIPAFYQQFSAVSLDHSSVQFQPTQMATRLTSAVVTLL